MSARNRKGTCAYCGQKKKLTVDHVPPKLFLERPFPPNLLTVPACTDYNMSFKDDDEYTRTVLAGGIRANWNYAAQSNLPAIMRSLQRRNARGFVEYLRQQSHCMNIFAIRELLAKHAAGGKTDDTRLEACVAKVVADLLERAQTNFMSNLEERPGVEPAEVFRQTVKEFVQAHK